MSRLSSLRLIYFSTILFMPIRDDDAIDVSAAY